MSADFLFSFLLFFQVQMNPSKIVVSTRCDLKSIQRFPKIFPTRITWIRTERTNDATGLNFEDLSEISVSEVLDGIRKASGSKSPKLGSDFEFVFQQR